MKISKIISNTFFALIAVLAVLLIVSSFPISGNFKVLVVKSGSMRPKIKTGSVVVVKPSADYSVGDVITFNEKSIGGSVTHRIVKISGPPAHRLYTTKGDANNAPDDNLIGRDRIIGKVLFSVPYLGYALDTVKRPWGFILVVVIPALLLISEEIKKIWQEIKKIKNSE